MRQQPQTPKTHEKSVGSSASSAAAGQPHVIVKPQHVRKTSPPTHSTPPYPLYSPPPHANISKHTLHVELHVHGVHAVTHTPTRHTHTTLFGACTSMAYTQSRTHPHNIIWIRHVLMSYTHSHAHINTRWQSGHCRLSES